MEKSSFLKRVLFIPPILIGIATIAVSACNRRPPQQKEYQEPVYNVRVIEVKEITLQPKVVGYGTVEANNTWRMISEVNGKIIWIHPRFKKGEFFKEKEELVHIDPTKYNLAVSRIQANIANIQAQLAEQDRQEKNLQASLRIERHSLKVKERDFIRTQDLVKNDTAALADLERIEREFLAQQSAVQSLENSLHLIPSKRDTFKAQLALQQVELEGAKIDLSNTKISTPFACRIDQVNAETSQYVQVGKELAVAYDIDFVQITAQVPMVKMRGLARSNLKPVALNVGFSEVAKMLGITAVVRLGMGDEAIEWQAQFRRTDSALDNQTRTVGVIVTVKDPYTQARIGERPPLTKGMYCEVQIRGRQKDGFIAVPRSAVHEGRYVYVADKENRLRQRNIKIDFTQDDLAVLKEGLTLGEKLVVSDVVPAVDGMLLNPIAVPELWQDFLKKAGGIQK